MTISSGGSSDLRANARSNVFLSATLNVGSKSFPARIRNISSQGAMLDGAELPSQGSAVRLVRGSHAADGEITWQSGELRGVRFSSSINVEHWVRRVGHAGQQAVDATVAALRLGSPTPTNEVQLDAGSKTLSQLSDELEQICERLASSARLSVETAEDLLKLDGIALSIRRIASASKR